MIIVTSSLLKSSVFKMFSVHGQKAKAEKSTSFPGSLILPPPSELAPGGGKMRDPGNEVRWETLGTRFQRNKAVFSRFFGLVRTKTTETTPQTYLR